MVIPSSSEALLFVLSRAVEEELNLFPSADHVQLARVHQVCLLKLLLAGSGPDKAGNFLGIHSVGTVGSGCTGAKCSHQRRHCLLKVLLLLNEARSRVTRGKFRGQGKHITLISLVMMLVMLMLQIGPNCLIRGRLRISGATGEETRHFGHGCGCGGLCDLGVVESGLHRVLFH